MRAARLRPEVFCEEMPAPQRIAPYASALSRRRDRRRRRRRHRPARPAARPRRQRRLGRAPSAAWPTPAPRSTPRWSPTRCSPRSAGLADRGARRARRGVRRRRPAPSPGSPPRASAAWPTRAPAPRSRSAPPGPRSRRRPSCDIGDHVEAWGELLCTAAGLPPVPEGVAAMPSRRGQRGRGLMSQSGPPDATVPDGASRRPSRGPERPPAPLLTLRDGLPAGRRDRRRRWPTACRAPRRRHRPGRDRRRARLRLPLLRRAPT